MRKIIIAILVFAVILPLMVETLELDILNLKGMNYVRFQCEYNGIPFYKASKNPNDPNPKEFGLKEIITALKETGISIGENNIKTIYSQMEKLLKEAGIRIVDIRIGDEKSESSILPTVNMNIEVTEVSKELCFCLIYITVSKWISNWSGTENIHTPMIAWWQKKILAASPEELNNTIEKAATELMNDFIIKLKEANTQEEQKSEVPLTKPHLEATEQ
jgi:hypothetical protein